MPIASAILIGSGIAAGGAVVGGGLSGWFAGESQEEAAKKQAAALREINQWGYGYPTALKNALLGLTGPSPTGAYPGAIEHEGKWYTIVGRTDYGAPGWKAREKELSAQGGGSDIIARKGGETLLLRPVPEGGLQEAGVGSYSEALRQGYGAAAGRLSGRIQELERFMPTAPRYREIAANTWNEALRGASEVAGLPTGSAEAARREMVPQYASSLAQAEIQGETDRAARIAALMSAEDTLTGYEVAPTEKSWAALLNALGLSTGVPKYSYEAPWPGMGGTAGAVAGVSGGLSDAALILGQMYGGQSGGSTINVNYPSSSAAYPAAYSNQDWFNQMRGGSSYSGALRI